MRCLAGRGVVVRASTEADMPFVTQIYARFVETSTATFEITAPSEAEMRKRRQTVLDLGLPYLVAELEGYVVGFCYASQFRPRRRGTGLRWRTQSMSGRIVLGMGLGKALLGALIEQCRLRRCHSMMACICGVNPGV